MSDGERAGASTREHHLEEGNPDDLLSPRKDPGAAALGASGSEASVDTSWFVLLHRRVGERAVKSARYQWWVLCALLSGLLALNFTFTAFNIALQPVAKQFNTSVDVLTWTMTGPLLAFGLAAPIFGRASDVFGHRRLYLFGLLGAMLSAVLTSLAVNAPMLLAARALDGVQGAATATASMALINSVFAREDRVKALGWWSLIGAGGPVLGVSVGALVIPTLGWRALFWIQLVLLAIAFVVVSAIIPRHLHEKPKGAKVSWDGMDWLGSWSLSAAVLSSMLALTFLPHHPLTSSLTLTLIAIAVVASGVFLWRMTHAATPLIPLHYFTNRNFVFPMAVRVSANFAYFGGFILFPILMEVGYNASTGRVGTISVARPIVFALASPIAGYAAVKFGERSTTIFGTIALTVSMAVFAFAVAGTSVWWLVLALGLSGIGMGVAMPSTSATMANEVDEHEYGVMSAAQLIATQVGEVAGIQIVIAIQGAKLRALGPHPTQAERLGTFHLSYWLGAAVGLVGVVAALFMRSMDRRTRPSEAEPVLEI